MNREIKFRIWDPDLKHMYSPYENHILIDTLGWAALLTENGLNYQNNYILMQFTGLLDSAGNEIYEGDLLNATSKDGLKFGFIVEFSDAQFMIRQVGYNTLLPNLRMISDFSTVETNIFETPELLEINK